jgi:hypothetical protein
VGGWAPRSPNGAAGENPDNIFARLSSLAEEVFVKQQECPPIFLTSEPRRKVSCPLSEQNKEKNDFINLFH